MAWLLDTNILSELKRLNPSYRVVAFVTGCPLDELYVSTITLAEIRFGIGLVADPVRRTELEQWLQDRVRPMFPEHVVEITETSSSGGATWWRTDAKRNAPSRSRISCLPRPLLSMV
jgi:predicted nucleic acid-binding protein